MFPFSATVIQDVEGKSGQSLKSKTSENINNNAHFPFLASVCAAARPSSTERAFLFRLLLSLASQTDMINFSQK